MTNKNMKIANWHDEWKKEKETNDKLWLKNKSIEKKNSELKATIEAMSNKDLMVGIIADKNEKIEQMEILDQSRREEIRIQAERIEKAIAENNRLRQIAEGEVDFLWKEYGEADDIALTKDGLELKRLICEIFKKVADNNLRKAIEEEKEWNKKQSIRIIDLNGRIEDILHIIRHTIQCHELDKSENLCWICEEHLNSFKQTLEGAGKEARK